MGKTKCIKKIIEKGIKTNNSRLKLQKMSQQQRLENQKSLEIARYILLLSAVFCVCAKKQHIPIAI